MTFVQLSFSSSLYKQVEHEHRNTHTHTQGQGSTLWTRAHIEKSESHYFVLQKKRKSCKKKRKERTATMISVPSSSTYEAHRTMGSNLREGHFFITAILNATML